MEKDWLDSFDHRKFFYVVHLHQIEDSYSFGVFDNIDDLKFWFESLERGMKKPMDESDFEEIKEMECGDEVFVEFNGGFGWDTIACVFKTIINQASIETIKKLKE